MDSIGKKIYNLRKQKEISQEELAVALNVSRQTVYKWENDSAQPTGENLTALCNILQADWLYFFPEDEEVNQAQKETESSAKKFQGFLPELGKTIRQIRQQKKLSQEAFAEKLDVSRQTVYNWETNQVYPSLENLMEICKVFKVSMSAFLKEECAIAGPSSKEEVQKEVEKKNENQKAMGIHYKRRIIILSVFSSFAMAILMLMLVILGLRAYPTNRGQSYVVHDNWRVSAEFIFWAVFSCFILIKNGNTQLAKRIVREQKIRGLRNMNKHRGGPHMRGLIAWFALNKILRDIFENEN